MPLKEATKDLLTVGLIKRVKLYVDEKTSELRSFFTDRLDNIQLQRGEKGDPGQDGKDGVNGLDGRDGKDGAAGQIGPQGVPGKDGPAGKNGLDGRDGLNGKDADETAIVAKIEADLPKLSEPIRDALELITDEDEKLKIEAIGKLREELDALEKLAKESKGRTIAGSRYLSMLADVDVANIAVGDVLIWGGSHWTAGPQSGGTPTIYTESLKAQTVDGLNVTYTTAHTITNVLNFSINGQYIHSADYTAVGSTITFNVALPADLSGKEFDIVYV